jgi:hypothetical protein
MPELVSIPIAIFEITIEYSRPSVRLMMDRKDIVEKLFDGFKPWQIKVDDLEVITEGKPSEQGVKFKIPTKRTSFFLGPAFCKLTRDDADWESAEDTIKILDAGLGTVTKLGGVEVGTYKTAIAMHLQPKTMPFIELLKPFAPAQIAALDPSAVKAIAAVVKWENRRVTIDGSGQLANGLFLRFEREFPASTTYDEIATQLRFDEDRLFDILDVKEDRP